MPQMAMLTAVDPTESGLVAAQLSLEPGFCKEISALRLQSEELRAWCACETGRHEDGSLSDIYLVAQFERGAREHELCFSVGERSDAARYDGGQWRIEQERGELFIDWGAHSARLQSWIEYDGRRVDFSPPRREALLLAGEGSGLRLTGEIHLPEEQRAGHYTFDFFTACGLDCLFVRSAVQYPYTTEDHEISSQASNLGRYSDVKWTQTAPFELALRLDDSAKVKKRSFAGAYSSYEIADFWRAFPQNENIAAFNHHLTGGLLSVAGKDCGGLLIAHARQVLGSMAHCPMRLRTLGGAREISLNPFGTYFGPQRYYPTRGNGSSMELYLAAAPQARSLAPAYNGAFEQSVQALFGLDGAEPTLEQRRLAEAIADGALILGGDAVRAFEGDNVRLHDPVDNKVEAKELKSVTFVEQYGGIGPVLGLVKRYLQNLSRAQRQMRARAKRLGGG